MFTAKTTRVSNPICSLSFRPSPSDLFWLGAFATGSLIGIITFYRYPHDTPNPSQSQVEQCFLHVDLLSRTISQEIYSIGYGRFRPNNRGSHSWRWCYRGGWHQSYPPLIRQRICRWQKPHLVKHVEFPYHTLVHCKVFAPAAPRRARASISVPFSGLPLSGPLQIFGLVSHYLTNYLICRRLIHGRFLLKIGHSGTYFLSGVILSFPRLFQTDG